MLKALPGFALIELPKKYESGLQISKEKYAVRSEGTLIDFLFVADQDDPITASDLYEKYEESRSKTVYFAPFEDGEVIKDENKEYVFVPLKSLRGVKDAEA